MLRKIGRTRGGWRYLTAMSWWWDALGWMVAEGLASHLSSGALCDCPIAFWWGPGTSDWSTHSLCPITWDSNARQMMKNVGWFLLPFSESWGFCFVWGQGLPSVLLLNSVEFHAWKRAWHQSGRGTLGPSHRRDWLLFLFLFLHVFLNQSLKQNDIRNGNSRARWGHLVKENSWEKATGTRASFQSSQTIHLHVAEGSRVTPNTVIQGPLNGLLGEFRTPEVNGSSKRLISHLLILGVCEPSLPICYSWSVSSAEPLRSDTTPPVLREQNPTERSIHVPEDLRFYLSLLEDHCLKYQSGPHAENPSSFEFSREVSRKYFYPL